MEKRIDLIVPAYRAGETLLAALCSALNQTVAGQLDVTVVDDASGDDSSRQAVDRARDLAEAAGLDTRLRLIQRSRNAGPATARQQALDETQQPFVAFLDADDRLGGPWVLQRLRQKLLQEPRACMAAGDFWEESQMGIVEHNRDLVWLFGKLYRRSFLRKYDIRFLPGSRSNEDNGFNAQLRLLCSQEEPVLFLPEPCYLWRDRKGSITRSGGYEREDLPGYAENMSWAVRRAKERGAPEEALLEWIAQTAANLYALGEGRGIQDGPCRRFLGEIYRPAREKIGRERMRTALCKAVAGACARGRLPKTSFETFLGNLEKGEA